MQLTATVKSGSNASPQIINSDGSQSPFLIPKGQAFVATDISIQRSSVVATAGLFNVSLVQDTPTLSQLRWGFVGSSAQNIERSFTTGIAFSTPFVVQNGVQLGDAVIVHLWGFLQG